VDVVGPGLASKNGGDLIQHTSAPDVPATVAPFRAWRDLQMIVAKGPKQVTIAGAKVYSEGRSGFKADLMQSLVLSTN